MATSLLSPNAKQKFDTLAGAPAAGYKLWTYAAGTTTPQATYSNRAGTVANTNPIILDARGECVVYLTPGLVYDYKLTTAADVLEWTQPGVSAQAGDAASVVFTQAGTGAVERLASVKMGERISPEDFGAVGDGLTNDKAAFDLARDYILSLPAGGTLTCTPGKKYAFGSKWSIIKTAGKQFNIDMNGCEFTKTTGGYVGAIMYYGNTTDVAGAYPLNIRNGRFQGVGASGTGVELEWAGGSRFDGVVFLNFVNGAQLTNSFGVRFTNKTQFLDCSTAAIICKTIAHHLTVDGCGFFRNQRDVYFETGMAAYNLNFVNNDCEGSAAASSNCLTLDGGGSAINVDGNYIEGKNGSPVVFGAAVESFNFTNNWLGYNTGTQAWVSINSGVMEGNIFWDQAQTMAATVKDFDIGQNTYAGTSNKLYTPWTAPTLTNGFTNTGGTWAGNVAGYRKDRHGVVHLRGMVQAAADASAFSLPAGYRPAGLTPFLGATAGGAATNLCRVQVSAGGSVTVFRGTDTTGDLSMVSFTATQ